MSKEDTPRIELLQAVHPGRRGWQRLSMTVPFGSPGENVAAIGRRGVVALSRNDHIAVSASGYKRLVSFCMAGCWDQEDARQHLSLAVDLLVPTAFNQLRQRVVKTCPRCCEFGRLNKDRPITEKRVTAAVVEVEVAVGHMRYLVETGANGGQRGLRIASSGAVVSVDIGTTTRRSLACRLASAPRGELPSAPGVGR